MTATRGLWRSAHLLAAAGLLALTCGTLVAGGVVAFVTFLRPLALPHADRLVSLGGLAYGQGMPDPVGWWGQARGLGSIVLYRVGESLLGEGQAAEWTRTAEVSGGFSQVVGVAPVAGRLLGAADADSRVAMVGENLWRRRLAARPPGSDLAVTLGGHTFLVVGVVPSTLRLPAGAEVWIPRPTTSALSIPLVEHGGSGLPPASTQTGWYGRLAANGTIEQVRVELSALQAKANDELSPKTRVRYGTRLGVTALQTTLTRQSKEAIAPLLIACLAMWGLGLLNGALLFVWRRVRLWGDLSIRAMLGASREALIRTSLKEGAIVGLVAGVGAAGVMIAVLRHFAQAIPQAPLLVLSVEPQRLMFAAGAMVVGMLSAFCAWVISAGWRIPTDAFSMRRDATTSPSSRRLRQVLLVSQVAATTFLVIALLASTQQLEAWDADDPGYTAEGSVTAVLAIPSLRVNGQFIVPDPTLTSVMDRIGAVGGVTTVALASELPVTASRRTYAAFGTGSRGGMASTIHVHPDYFAAMGIALIEGQAANSATDVVINRRLAEVLWPGGGAVGQALELGGQKFQVVGVAATTIPVGPGAQAEPEAYLRLRHDPSPAPHRPVRLIVRCESNCRQVRQEMLRPPAPHEATIARIDTVTDLVALESAEVRARSEVVMAFAFVAVMVSIVALLTFTGGEVTARARESGIRLSLGEPRRRLVWGLSHPALLAVGIGVCFGASGAATVSRWVTSVIPGVASAERDLVVLASLLVAAIGVAASCVPTLRIVRQAPALLLRRRT